MRIFKFLEYKSISEKEIMLNGSDIDDFIEALRYTYGETVPCFHATTEENAKEIRKNGLIPQNGKNYISFSSDPFFYLQIGKSDYVDSIRNTLLRFDIPLDFMDRYANADMDSINIKSEGEADDIDSSDFRDFYLYYINNNYSFEGMELIFIDRENDMPPIYPVN